MMGWRELQSFGSQQDQDVGSSKHDNIPDSYIKNCKFYYLRAYQLVKDSPPRYCMGTRVRRAEAVPRRPTNFTKMLLNRRSSVIIRTWHGLPENRASTPGGGTDFSPLHSVETNSVVHPVSCPVSTGS
jgi:hypothetical protein